MHKSANMRTTLNLPDDLFRTIKVMAAQQNRTLQSVMAELLRRGLAYEPLSEKSERVKLPLVTCAHPAPSVTPEYVADLLLAQETDDSLR
jgi:plasmid stability protein